jgi:hypothetical protein
MLPCIPTPTQTQICTAELPLPILTRTQICTVELPLRTPSNKAVLHIAFHHLLQLNSITRHLLLLHLLPWLEMVNTKHTGLRKIMIISELLHPHLQSQCTTCRDNLRQPHRTIHHLLRLLRLHLIEFCINKTHLSLLALLTNLG